MKPIKNAVAIVIRNARGEFLIIRRPLTDKLLKGAWGFPALMVNDRDNEVEVARKVGLLKLGVRVKISTKIGEQTHDRGDYILRLSDYEATIIDGEPSVPQQDLSVTQYIDWKYMHDPTVLIPSAKMGSVCSRVFLASERINWRL